MLRTTLLPLACAAVLFAALPPSPNAQTAPADDNEALHNIQSNFAHMTPPPRSVQSINQDLQQTKAAPANRQGGGRGGRGKMRQQQQQDGTSSGTKPQAAQDVPVPSANQQPSATPATTP